MPVFDILCLANSNKRSGSCIAGLRLDGGGWIRPVAARTRHGELYPAHYILQDGSCPQLFDRIRISFRERRVSAHQPENWLISDRSWELVSRGLFPEFAPLLQSNLSNGSTLFGDTTHKIPFDRFRTEPALSSLCLIWPGNLRWRIEKHPYNAHKAIAQFQLAGKWYRLPVTDPARLNMFRSLPPGEYPVTACGIAPEIEVLLTVSVSEPWEDGYCYKLVAGILPLDGTDPCAGRSLPVGSPLSNPDTAAVLGAAAPALRSGPVQKTSHAPLAQAGKAWGPAEEDALVREFEAGETMAVIAHAHGRTPGAIKCRLIRLGEIAE